MTKKLRSSICSVYLFNIVENIVNVTTSKRKSSLIKFKETNKTQLNNRNVLKDREGNIEVNMKDLRKNEETKRNAHRLNILKIVNNETINRGYKHFMHNKRASEDFNLFLCKDPKLKRESIGTIRNSNYNMLKNYIVPASDKELMHKHNSMKHVINETIKKIINEIKKGIDINGDNLSLKNLVVKNQIGHGAYASVKLAYHKLLNKEVALKIYKKNNLINSEKLKGIKREINTRK